MDDQEKKHKLNVKPAQETDIALPLTVSMRAYFSSYHLWGARAFSAAAGRIEAAHSGQPRFDIGHRAYVINSILAAVAFAEAAINEVFKDASDDHAGALKDLSTEAVSMLADYWSITEIKNKSHISLLDKFQLALRFCGAEPFKTDRSPYQNAHLVVCLRNALVHYKPESISAELNHKLTRRLRGKFPTCRLFEDSYNPFYPDHCLGHGCSEWALNAMHSLANDFFDRIGVKPNYQMVDFGAPEL